MDDATNSLTNEQIVRMLGWKDYQTDAGYTVWLSRDGVKWHWPPDYLKRLDLCLRDILPEIVRRGYSVNVLFWGHGTEVHLTQRTRLVERWECTDPPSIARAICEALVTTEGRE